MRISLAPIRVPELAVVDGYKLGHQDQYPKDMAFLGSNFTARSASHLPKSKHYDNTFIWVGFSDQVIEFVTNINETFFQVPFLQAITKWKSVFDPYIGESVETERRLKDLHALGFLPLDIRQLAEGKRYPIKLPVFTVKNTVAGFGWLVNFVETNLSTRSWKATTCATIAGEYRRICESFAVLTGSPLEFVDFQCHDFSARGMSGASDALDSGIGHLTVFTGSDNFGAIWKATEMGIEEGELVAATIPATEHSVTSSNILRVASKMGCDLSTAEYHALKNFITVTYPSGMCGWVSDTYDFWNLVGNILPKLKSEIMSRDGKLVIRPDSGDPVKVLTGYSEDEYVYRNGKYFEVICDTFHKTGRELLEVEVKGLIESLWDTFGGTMTDKGFKVLDSHIGAIYGDSITIERAEQVLQRLADKGFASCNVVLGVGSYTYNYMTRDTLGFAMKATWYETFEGELVELYKDPKTADASKKSARGKLRVNENMELEQQCDSDEGGLLKPIFVSGEFIKENIPSFSDIRNNFRESNRLAG